MDNKELIRVGKRLGWIVFFFLVAMLVISAIEAKKAKPAKEVLISIQHLPDGNDLIDKNDINLAIERAFGFNLTGIPVREIDVARVERVLESDPFIHEADVFIDASNLVHIEVSQREPILRIIDKNGVNYYLDEFGEKMPLSKHFTARVLVATGNIPPFDKNFLRRKKRNTLKDLFELTNIFMEDEFLNPLIEQVYVTNSRDYHLIPNLGDQKIILGNMDNLEEKLFYLETFYKEAVPHKGWQRYKTINLKFKGQVVARKR